MTIDAIRVEDYYDPAVFRRIKDLADTKETPFVVIDTETVGNTTIS